MKYIALMRCVVVALLCFLTLNVSAQFYAGIGGTYDDFGPRAISDLTFNATAGCFLRQNDKWHLGFSIVYQTHAHNVLTRNAPPLLPRNSLFHSVQRGITPSLCAGPKIDKHLLLGLAAGYEFLSYEHYWTNTWPPPELVNDVERRFKTGRASFNVLAQVNVFPDWRFSPVLMPRYGLLVEKGQVVKELALSFCVMYNAKKSK